MRCDKLLTAMFLILLLTLFFVNVRAQETALALNAKIVKNQIILPEPVIVKIELFKFGSSERQDIIINKIIKDSKNETVYLSQKTIALETSVSFIDTINLQKDLAPGVYTLKIFMDYDNRTVSNTETFEIMKEKFHITISTVIGTIVIIVFILILIVIFRRLKKINELFGKLYKSKDFEKNIKGRFM